MNKIVRAAVGRVAHIGDLYNARTDSFCGLSLLKKSVPKAAIRITDNPYIDTQFVLSDSYSDKFDKLEIKDELKVSILAGLFQLEGHGKYLHDEKKSAKAVRCSLLYKIKTKVEYLNIFNEELKECFALDALNVERATHVVVEVSWGATSLVTLEYANSKNDNKKEIQGLLQVELNKIASGISGEAEVDYHLSENKQHENFTFRVFGDILPTDEDLPQTFEGVLSLMKKMPRLVRKSNNGRGKPLQYTMIPLSELEKYLGVRQTANRMLKQIDQEQIIRFVKVHEEIHQLKQSLNDLYNDMHNHKCCFHQDLKKVKQAKTELDVTEANFRQRSAKTLIDARSGIADAMELESLLSEYGTEGSKVVKMSDVLNNYHHLIKKMSFVDTLIKKGVKYIGYGSSMEIEQMKNPSVEIYVLLFSEELKRYDHKAWDDNLSHFLSLLRSVHKQSATFIVIDLDAHPDFTVKEGVDERIKYINYVVFLEYQTRKLLSIAKSLQPMEFTTQKPNKRVDIEMRCPGSLSGTCDKMDHTWVCQKCNETIEYGFDGYFYCSCGRAPAHSFEFKCNNKKHGLDFLRFKKDNLEELLKKIRPMKEMNILILGETGVGKSTWINAIANYMTYSTLEEATQQKLISLLPSKFTITDNNDQEHVIKTGEDKNEDHTDGQSATQEPRAYGFHFGDTLLRLIDTPGVGDTRGIEHDKKNFDATLRYLSNLEELHGIVILLKPNNARLGVTFTFCIKELLTHLHQSASNNIVFLFTNARSTFYKSGDTLPAFKTILSQYKIITLSKHTTYYVDNEAFRFLCAINHGIKFNEDDRKDFLKSWNKSVTETNRMINHFASLNPHQVKDTLSLNDAKRIILSSTRPLADISKNIQDNINLIEDNKNAIKFSKESEEELAKKLYTPILDLVAVPLGYPRTVCTDSKHVKAHTTGSNTIIEYSTVCHEKCYITGTKPETYPNPELKNCSAMAFDLSNQDHKCRTCGCSWEKHMHITYEYKREYKKIIDESVKSQIDNKKSDRERISEFIENQEDNIKKLEEEHKVITSVCVKFGYFLKTNAITPYNDALKGYLNYLIDNEKDKVDQGGRSNTLKSLNKFLKSYEEEVIILEKSMNSGHNISEIKPHDIKAQLQELYDLPIKGKDLKQIIEVALSSNSKLMDYHETLFQNPKHTKDGQFKMSVPISSNLMLTEYDLNYFQNLIHKIFGWFTPIRKFFRGLSKHKDEL